MRLVAEWENQSDKKVAEKSVQRTLQQLRDRRVAELEERRKRLATLLEEDDRRYADEFLALQESPDQVKARMEARARELKEKHEAERSDFAQRMLDRKWKDECDELRGLVAKQQVLQVATDRVKQLEEKRELADVQAEHEKMWHELWEQDRLRKLEREHREAQQKKDMSRQTLQILDEQMVHIRERNNEAQRIKDEEAALLREQWDLQKKQADQLEADLFRQKVARKRELQRYNKAAWMRKMEEVRREKEEGLEFLRQVLEREKFEMECEQRVKDRHREEQIAYRQQLIATWAREKDENAELDRLCEEEREREWAKREAKWARERAAREQLMTEVIEERKRQIEERLRKKREERDESFAARERLMVEVERMTREAEEEQNERQKRAHENRDALLLQMQIRKDIRDDDRLRRQQEHEQALAKEAEFMERLQIEKDKILQQQRDLMAQQRQATKPVARRGQSNAASWWG